MSLVTTWHTLIEADNYHALQLLEYLYAGQVDCIYIDPPYNTGAKDWKYNNDYVDSNDQYRHSKWLSFMEKRLKLAKQLLNPKNSALIVTIDEKEYLHLGCLLEQMFPEARIQMISSVINPAGAGKGNKLFARTDEYIFMVQLGESVVSPESREVENVPVIWDTLRRSSLANARGRHGKGACGPNQFYPIYVENSTGRIKAIGKPIAEDVDRMTVPQIEGCTAVFPVRPDGTEMNWGVSAEKAKEIWSRGYLRAGKYTPNAPQQYVISYVTGGNIKDIEAGVAVIERYNEDGSVIAYYPKGRDKMPTTNWNRPLHDAQRYGTNIISPMIGGRFNYPKSLYAVKDCINFFVADKKDALIVDFFAGSGTTMHAVNLLNSEDGGRRRCICITNNEVSDVEAKKLQAEGYRPGDNEWLELGIARYVTWPRIKCSITGQDVDGKTLKGNYENGRSLSEGFKENAIFFKLGFLDKTSVALGRQLSELFPVGNKYGRYFYNPDDPNEFKIDVILYAADDNCMARLMSYAERMFHKMNDDYRRKIIGLEERFIKQYNTIVSDGDIVSKHNFRLPETITQPREINGRNYTDHLFVDDSGTAKINLNNWEEGVLEEEQSQTDFVCWLRNPPRKPWSLCIPYEMRGEQKPAYPDFIIVRKDSDMEYVIDILEPHDPTRIDNLGKAKGFAEYARQNPGVGRIQLIRMGKDGAGKKRFKRLDMARSLVRDKVSRAMTNDELDHIFETDGFFM